MKKQRTLAAYPQGFTLLELILVLFILAAVAGLLIPQFAMLGRSTDMATSAKSQQDIAHNIQVFFTLQKRYPQGMDSLLDTDLQPYGPDVTGSENDALQTQGLPVRSANGIRVWQAITPAVIDNSSGSYLRSFTRAGFSWVFDHNRAALHANDSTVNQPQRLLSADPTVAEVVPTTPPNGLPVPAADTSSADNLLRILAPNGLRAGERVVALGFGQRNSAIGVTALSAPVYAGNAGSYYGYYIAYFKLYPNGERATLLGVSDCYGRTPVYTQQQFNESLPDGSRQG